MDHILIIWQFKSNAMIKPMFWKSMIVISYRILMANGH